MKKPALHPFIAFLLFLFYRNYFIYTIIPYSLSILIDLFSIDEYVNSLLIYTFKSALLFFLSYLLCIFFYSSFWVTTAITGHDFTIKDKFFSFLINKMLKSKILFIIIFLLYCFIGFSCVFLVCLFLYFPYVPLNWYSEINSNYYFPFSPLEIVFTFIFFFITFFLILNDAWLTFIIFPIQFYIWRIK